VFTNLLNETRRSVFQLRIDTLRFGCQRKSFVIGNRGVIEIERWLEENRVLEHGYRKLRH